MGTDLKRQEISMVIHLNKIATAGMEKMQNGMGLSPFPKTNKRIGKP